MAKRFTDTEKWKDPWFDELSGVGKLFFFFYVDQCDCAGIWKPNLKQFSYFSGFAYTSEKIKDDFGTKLVWLDNGNLFMPSFISFQYGKLNPKTNKAHLGVAKSLEKHNINLSPFVAPTKPLASPLLGAQEQEQEQEQELDKESLIPNLQKAKTVPKSANDSKIMNALLDAWRETMMALKIHKDPKFDEVAIARLLGRHGFEKTLLALTGARYEDSTNTFNPAKNLSISRISKPNIFEKCVTLGSFVPETKEEETEEELEAIGRGCQ